MKDAPKADRKSAAKSSEARNGRYQGRATKVGNSKGFRLESDFFKDHPEFNDADIEVQEISPGIVMLSTVHPLASEQDTWDKEENDPVLLGFLAMLEKDISEGKGVTDADSDQLDRIGKLIEGVELD